PYRPQFELWTDAAVKYRWLYIPECAKVETLAMGAWDFPVGMRVWKEFVIEGDQAQSIPDKRIETRLITRTGTGINDFVFATYVWNDEETDAVLMVNGVQNA